MNSPVILVIAPCSTVLRPALGVSTLKSALELDGIPTSISYLNFTFAERVGVDFNEFIAERLATVLLAGEWIFANALNGDRNPAMDVEYLQWLTEYTSNDEYEQIVEARQIAPDFVEEAADRLVALKPRLIGFSTTFAQNCASLAIAAKIKAKDPGILICFGGANCEGCMGRALIETYEQIDYVFSGEADHTFPQFVRRFIAGEKPFTTDPSILSRNHNSELVDAEPIQDLDALPVPDFSDYFNALRSSSFGNRIRPGLLFESSRGCWWGAKKHCRFCGLNGTSMAYRSKSAKRTLEELDYLANKWEIRRFEAADNILNMKHVESVLGTLAKRKDHYRFFYEIKSNMNYKQLEKAACGGVTWIQPGIENLSDEILELMEKGVTGLQNIRLLRSCAELGIRCNWNMLQGFPGEKAVYYRNMLKIVPAIEHLDPPTGLSTVRVDRFSPYYDRAEELGFTHVRPGRAYQLIYDLPMDVLNRLAYFFIANMAEVDGDGSYTTEIREALTIWRERVFDSEKPPELKVIRLGPLSLVVDTRTCAPQHQYFLAKYENCVLESFRNPMDIDRQLQLLQKSNSSDFNPYEIFERLKQWQYIVVDSGRAISVVVEAANRIHNDDDYLHFPGGWLEQSKSTVVPEESAQNHNAKTQID